MKNLQKLSREQMKSVQGAIRTCNPQIICQVTADCCPGWVCGSPGEYCIAY
ncbi:hypothetical protein DRF59_11795 [Chryseobacterium flavum]|uniref:Ion channel inhibitory toxin n=1 Tax=Chryseobacterium flavum TaxID=415851 RepID=A0A3D9CLB8_9FLAO|nr:hypothetical protein [Chryseobacterium flavum]REC66510.1 hypothetical protein DRF59_11795 [Chryseobacterium flavum]